jgi:hypothetical protein
VSALAVRVGPRLGGRDQGGGTPEVAVVEDALQARPVIAGGDLVETVLAVSNALDGSLRRWEVTRSALRMDDGAS